MAATYIDENICKGCGLCVDACPKKILVLANERINIKGFHFAAVSEPKSCIGCAFCAVMCPHVAITVEK